MSCCLIKLHSMIFTQSVIIACNAFDFFLMSLEIQRFSIFGRLQRIIKLKDCNLYKSHVCQIPLELLASPIHVIEFQIHLELPSTVWRYYLDFSISTNLQLFPIAFDPLLLWLCHETSPLSFFFILDSDFE